MMTTTMIKMTMMTTAIIKMKTDDNNDEQDHWRYG